MNWKRQVVSENSFAFVPIFFVQIHNHQHLSKAKCQYWEQEYNVVVINVWMINFLEPITKRWSGFWHKSYAEHTCYLNTKLGWKECKGGKGPSEKRLTFNGFGICINAWCAIYGIWRSWWKSFSTGTFFCIRFNSSVLISHIQYMQN